MSAAKLKTFVGARMRRLRKKMANAGLDGLIVENPVDVSYLTGFSGDDSVLVVYGNRKILVTDSRYQVQVRQECPGLPIKLHQGALIETVAEILKGKENRQATRKKTPRKIGIESANVTHSHFKLYRKYLGRMLCEAEGLVGNLRLCKDDYELAQIRKAIRIAETAMEEVKKYLKIGMSEQEAAARLEYEMARRSGGPAAFRSIVAWAGHAAQPHAIPGKMRLRPNQPILFDWGTTVNGYRSDLTRCYCVGRIRPVFADAYQCLLEAQLTAIKAVKPGQVIAAVDSAARKCLQEGLDRCSLSLPVYQHGTGHGLGRDIHESPFIRPDNKTELQPGMVITIEPGIYVPGRFGIRIEDDVLVTETGHKVLSRIAKDLDSVAL